MARLDHVAGILGLPAVRTGETKLPDILANVRMEYDDVLWLPCLVLMVETLAMLTLTAWFMRERCRSRVMEGNGDENNFPICLLCASMAQIRFTTEKTWKTEERTSRFISVRG